MADFDWDTAGTGATIGATAGTAVMPGIGTAVGAVGGGLLGGYLGGSDDPLIDARERESRMAQGAGVQQLGLAAQGKGPSAAQDLLERNRSEGQQRALSNAKSLSGGNAALAGTLANRQQAQVSADTGLQSATLRAQEQQNAMQAYQAALDRRRQQDLDQMQAREANAAKEGSGLGSMMGAASSIIGGFS